MTKLFKGISLSISVGKPAILVSRSDHEDMSLQLFQVYKNICDLYSIVVLENSFCKVTVTLMLLSLSK